MKLGRTTFILYSLLTLLLSACNFSLTGGPQTWIDKPLDGTTVPLGPVSVLAHASDSDGVASMEFSVNSQPIPPAVIPAQDPGVSLFHGEKEFIPGGPGEYQIEVYAIDSDGNMGAPAYATVIISGEAEPAPPAEAPATDAPETEAPATEPPATQPPSSGEVSVSFYASPNPVEAGKCSTLHWDVEGTDKVLWNGSSVYFRGTEERCICEPETHKLQVTKADNSTQDYWVTIEVTGNCSAPATELPPGEVIEPDPIPVDNTPPSIFGAATDKASMCASQTVTANIITGDEESPVQKVYANWAVTDSSGNTVNSGNKTFTPISGQAYGYTAQFSATGGTGGSLTINIVVENSLNPPLKAYSTLTVTIDVC